MSTRALETSTAVIDALGGTRAVADRFGFSYQRVANWRAFGRFPKDTFLLITTALSEIECGAPASLWGQIQVEAAE